MIVTKQNIKNITNDENIIIQIKLIIENLPKQYNINCYNAFNKKIFSIDGDDDIEYLGTKLNENLLRHLYNDSIVPKHNPDNLKQDVLDEYKELEELFKYLHDLYKNNKDMLSNSFELGLL